MKQIIIIALFVTTGFTAKAQRLEMARVASMKTNGTTDEWRWTEIDTVKKVDTMSVFIDSAITNASGITIGFRTDKGVLLLKEKPKPPIKLPTMYITDTLGMYSGAVTYGDPVWSGRVIHKKHKTKKPARKHKAHYTYYKTAVETSYETVTYFKGYGVVDADFGDFIVLRNPKGIRYNKRVKSN